MNKKSMKMTFEGVSLCPIHISRLIVNLANQIGFSKEEEKQFFTAIHEAVKNCIEFAYLEGEKVKITIVSELLKNNVFKIVIKDYGVGIEDVEKAQQPLYTTKEGDKHSGMGFTIMQSNMSEVNVKSVLGKGTTVTMLKYCNKGGQHD